MCGILLYFFRRSSILCWARHLVCGKRSIDGRHEIVVSCEINAVVWDESSDRYYQRKTMAEIAKTPPSTLGKKGVYLLTC